MPLKVNDVIIRLKMPLDYEIVITARMERVDQDFNLVHKGGNLKDFNGLFDVVLIDGILISLFVKFRNN